jgi:hypothetical protein
VVVPDVDLGDLAVSSGEGRVAIPLDVVVVVVFVAVGTHLLAEWEFPSLMRTVDVGPGLERAVYSHSVIVDLVASSNHDVEGSLFVHA